MLFALLSSSRQYILRVHVTCGGASGSGAAVAGFWQLGICGGTISRRPSLNVRSFADGHILDGALTGTSWHAAAS